MDNLTLYAMFESPSAEWRGKPFWSWNGELDRDELVKQLRVMREMGFGGAFMHSRAGLITEYLSDEWFELINAVADECEKLGMEAWLYDEDRWPSGSAGGKVTEDRSLSMKSLVLSETTAESFEWRETTIAAFAASLNGLELCGYAPIERGESVEDALSAIAAEGYETKLLSFDALPDPPSSGFNGNTYIDTMSEKAVERFITLTHEQYAKHCGDRLGRSIKGIFSDEPHRGHAMDNFSEKEGVKRSSIFYTGDIFEQFKLRYGYDALSMLPEIFYRMGGEHVSRVRIDYFDLGCNLFDERFLAPVNAWCERHGILFTGHMLHEDSLSNQTVPNGSLMRGYQYMGAPGIDLLTGGNRCWWVVKQLTSACRQLDKKRLLSELYGCTGWEFPLRSHKAVGDWQALFGINLRCPHLSWYTMEGESKRDYPASILHQSPYWQDYELVETYFSRFGVMMSAGEPVCGLLTINPVESVWAIAHYRWASWINPVDPDVQTLERIYADTFNTLAGAGIDFDYGEEQMMARMGCAGHDEKGAFIKVGKAIYRAVLVSGALTLRSSTAVLLRQFLGLGGKVVFSGALPAYIGGWRSDECESLAALKGAVVCAPAEIADTVKKLLPSPIECGAKPSVFSQIRKTSDGYTCALVNTDRENPSGEFELRASLPEGYRAELWSLENGGRYLCPARRENGSLVVSLSLEAAGNAMVRLTDCADNIPALPVRGSVIKEEAIPDSAYPYSLDEPNVCVLDYARLSWNGGEWQPPEEVLKVDSHVRDLAGIEHRGGEMLQPWFAKLNYSQPLGEIALEYSFDITVMPSSPVTLAAERPELHEYYINGVRLTAPDLHDWWVDNAFVKLPVPDGTLKPGRNTVTMKTIFRRTTNIEACYLLGDFGIELSAGHTAITASPSALSNGELSAQSLPFYSGRVSYILSPEAYMPSVDRSARRVSLRLNAFSGALAVVEAAGIVTRVAWEPWLADVTAAVKASAPIKVTLVCTRRNTFGPLHIVPTVHGAYGPGHFVTDGDSWSDEYSLVSSKIGDITFVSEE